MIWHPPISTHTDPLFPYRALCRSTHARRCGADLVLRLKVDALRFVAAMIYAGVNIQFRKPRVDMIGTTLAPFLDKLGAVPVAFLRAKTLFVHRAPGAHDLGMGLRQPRRGTEVGSASGRERVCQYG